MTRDMTDPDLSARLDLLIWADILKSAPSGLTLTDGTRREFRGEAAWHRALWAMVFARDLRAWGADPDRVRDSFLWDEAARAASGALLASRPVLSAAEMRAAERIHTARDLFQALFSVTLSRAERDALRASLSTGEAAFLADDWPEAHVHATGLVDRTPLGSTPEFRERLAFLMEADLLKSVTRGTPLCDNSRKERSGEHSWHVSWSALLFSDYAAEPVDLSEVVAMLMIHDLVEIDAGDAPIHGDHDAAALAIAEDRAATRIFGLLPAPQGAVLRALWDRFEAAESSEAVFAKALDRVHPVLCNLETGGGTWREYDVTLEQLETRVGVKVRRGAPAIWEALRPRIEGWFAQNAL